MILNIGKNYLVNNIIMKLKKITFFKKEKIKIMRYYFVNANNKVYIIKDLDLIKEINE